MNRSTLTLLKEGVCNIKVVVVESNLATSLQEHQETTEKGSGGNVHL